MAAICAILVVDAPPALPAWFAPVSSWYEGSVFTKYPAAAADRNAEAFKVACIGKEFDYSHKKLFSVRYMRQLF
jgi:hypothetical protein